MLKALALGVLLALQASLTANPFGMDNYEQKLEIIFSSPDACAGARLEILPLYHGAPAAKLVAADAAAEPVSLSQPLSLGQGLNSQFYAVMAGRVDRELGLGRASSSYAYAFSSGGDAKQDQLAQKNLDAILMRAGFYLLCGQAASQLRDTPFLSYSNASPSTETDAWVCSPGQYAAYRCQALYNSIQAVSDGSSLFITLERPAPLDLNEMIPLSFVIKGVPASQVLRVRVKSAQARRFNPASKNYCFDLPHDALKAVPTAFGSKAMQVEAKLSRTGDGLSLDLKNTGDSPLENIRVAFRLPLKYSDGVLKNWAGSLEAGENREVLVAVHEASQDPLFISGQAYDVAQIDAWRGSKAFRTYATCLEDAPL